MARRKKRRLNIKNIVLAVIFVIAVISAVIAIVLAVGNWGGSGETSSPSSESRQSSQSSSSSSSASSVVSDPDDSWQLILANPSNPVPEGFTVNLTDITGNYADIPALDNMKVDSRIVEPLEQMFKDARAAGQNLFLRASYRSGSAADLLRLAHQPL